MVHDEYIEIEMPETKRAQKKRLVNFKVSMSLNFKTGEPNGSVGRTVQRSVYTRLEVKSDLEDGNVP